MAGLQSGEGGMMIDSVVWARYINVTDTQTATSPYEMLRQRTAFGRQNVKKIITNCGSLIVFHRFSRTRHEEATFCLSESTSISVNVLSYTHFPDYDFAIPLSDLSIATRLLAVRCTTKS